MHVLSLSLHPPTHPAVYILVYKTCSESLESICLCGFIKNYQHTMQRVEITIMWCPSDVIAFSILWVFNPHLSPLHHLPSPPPIPRPHFETVTTLEFTNDFCIMYSFIDSARTLTHTHTHTHMLEWVQFLNPPLRSPKLLQFFLSVLVKWKLKLHCFN